MTTYGSHPIGMSVGCSSLLSRWAENQRKYERIRWILNWIWFSALRFSLFFSSFVSSLCPPTQGSCFLVDGYPSPEEEEEIQEYKEKSVFNGFSIVPFYHVVGCPSLYRRNGASSSSSLWFLWLGSFLWRLSTLKHTRRIQEKWMDGGLIQSTHRPHTQISPLLTISSSSFF